MAVWSPATGQNMRICDFPAHPGIRKNTSDLFDAVRTQRTVWGASLLIDPTVSVGRAGSVALLQK